MLDKAPKALAMLANQGVSANQGVRTLESCMSPHCHAKKQHANQSAAFVAWNI